MEEQHKHIDDLFREQLGNYTEAPPPMAWNAIEKKLDQNGRHKRMMPWWPLLVLMLLGSTVTGYFVINHKLLDTTTSGKTTVNSNEQNRYTNNAGTNNNQAYKHNTNTTTNSNTIATDAPASGTGSNGTATTNDVTNGRNDNNAGNNADNVSGVINNKPGAANSTIRDRQLQNNGADSQNDKKYNKNTSRTKGNQYDAKGNATGSSYSTGYGNNDDGSNAKAGYKNTKAGKPGNNNGKDGITQTKQGGDKGDATKQDLVNNRNDNAADNGMSSDGKQRNGKKGNRANMNDAGENASGKTSGNITATNYKNRNKTRDVKTGSRPNKDDENAEDNGTNKQYGGKNGDNNKKPLKLTAANDGKKKGLNLKGKDDNGPRKKVKEDEEPGYTVKNANAKSTSDGSKKQTYAQNENNRNGNKKMDDNDPGYTVNDNNKTAAKTDPNSSVKKVAADLPKPPKDPREGILVSDYLNATYGEKNKPGDDKEDDEKETAANKKNDAGGGGDDKPIGGGGQTSSPSPKKNSGFEGGIKLGYERGLTNYTAAKEVVEIFAQFNISKKVVMMVQPAIKFAKTNKTFNFESGYYNITSNSHVAKPDSQINNLYHHTYKESYDSFYVKRSYEQRYTEFDIPLIFKYMVDKNLSIFAGLNVTIGKILKVTEDKTSITSYSNTYTNSDSTSNGRPFDAVFHHSGNLASTYDATQYQNPTSNPLRFGYLLGLSYELNQRFLFDLLIQQNLAGQTYIPNKDIRSIYTQPYFRFSIGYKLFGGKKTSE